MQRKGFTLIELAIVLTIVGIIVGGSFGLLRVQKEKASINAAQKHVDAAIDAVIGNTIINNDTLPDYNFFTNSLVPKLDNEKDLLYVYDNTLISTNICVLNSTALSVVVTTSSGNKTVQNVAFVIASSSYNKNMQTAYNSTTKQVVVHYPAQTSVDDNSTDMYRPEQFDDVVHWVTLSELQKKANCSENEHKLAILNDTALPRDLDTSNNYLGSSSAVVHADGGLPFTSGGKYQWCIDNAPNWLVNNSCNGALVACGSGFSQCDAPSLDGIPTLRGNNLLSTAGDPGSDSFHITVKDAAGNTVTKAFSVTIDHDTSSSSSSGGSGGGLGFGR